MAKPMLQSNSGETYSQSVLFTVVSPALKDNAIKSPSSVTADLMDLFEDVTGWKIGFFESKASQQRRAVTDEVSEENGIVEGSFSIVDMSETWPEQKPTCHRKKCDDLVNLIDSLVGELQTTRHDLQQTRSALAGFAPEAIQVDQNEILTDSFVPKFNYGRRWSDTEFELATDPSVEVAVDTNETAFTVEFDLPDNGSAVAPPFEGWSLGGETGIVGKSYLDWLVSNDEKIVMTSGKIESSFGTGDSQTIVEIDPLTNEFSVTGNQDLETFYLWDSKSQTISPLKASQEWDRLTSGQAIVATTSVKFGELVDGEAIDGRQRSASSNDSDRSHKRQPFTAERVSELLGQKLGEFDDLELQQDKLLVLMRDSR